MVFSVYSCVLLLFMSRRPTTQKTFGPGRIRISGTILTDCNGKTTRCWQFYSSVH